MDHTEALIKHAEESMRTILSMNFKGTEEILEVVYSRLESLKSQDALSIDLSTIYKNLNDLEAHLGDIYRALGAVEAYKDMLQLLSASQNKRA